VEAEIVFPQPLVRGTLVRRYKRFLADVRLASGETLTVLCANTGSMKRCSEPGRPVALSFHPAPHRKYPHTWEMIRMDAGWVGVNTHLPNNLVERALRCGMVPELRGFPGVKREVRHGENTRFDFLLEGPPGRCWVEVKSVSLADDEAATFPDAVTARGTRHLEELTAAAGRGDRAAMVFVVQRPEGKVFRPADAIDPEYGAALRRAAEAGVEILVYRANVSPERIVWGDAVSKDLSPVLAA